MADKLAIIIAINAYPTCPLNGCLADGKSMKSLLETHLGYVNFIQLTDESDVKPTYDNIIASLLDVASKSWRQNLSQVFLHYSGHGTQVKDTSGDEKTYSDQGICPVDYEKGIITDDDLSSILKVFNPKTHVCCVFDACHSGSMIDAPFVLNPRRPVVELDPSRKVFEKAWRNRVVALSGCRDEQTSADAYGIDGIPVYGGALTSYLVKAITTLGPMVSYKLLIDTLHKYLADAKYDQYPILTATYELLADSIFISKAEPIWKLQ